MEINKSARRLLRIPPGKNLERIEPDLIPAPYTANTDCENLEIEFPGGKTGEPQIGLLSQCDFYQGNTVAGKLLTIRNITEIRAAEKARAAQAELEKKVNRNADHSAVMETSADLENMLLNLFIDAKDAMPMAERSTCPRKTPRPG